MRKAVMGFSDGISMSPDGVDEVGYALDGTVRHFEATWRDSEKRVETLCGHLAVGPIGKKFVQSLTPAVDSLNGIAEGVQASLRHSSETATLSAARYRIADMSAAQSMPGGG